MNENKVSLIVTGLEILLPQTRSIDSVVQQLIQEAKREIHVAAYLLTKGALHIIEQLERSAENGIKITILVDHLEEQEYPIVRRLKSLATRPNVSVISFCDPKGGHLHAKVLVVDRTKAVIGSANLSWGGMVTNYEIGVLVEGETAWKIAEIIDRLVMLAKQWSEEIT